MSTNIFSKLAISNKPHKGSFDLSYRNILSCEFGQLIPFDIRECVPSDHFRLSTTTFTRTKPLVSAAYSRFREHIDYYFVPYRLLWRFSDSFFTKTPVNNSAMSAGQSSDTHNSNLPYFTAAQIRHVLGKLGSSYKNSNNKDVYVRDAGDLHAALTTRQLLNALGYGEWLEHLSDQALASMPNTNVFRALAYQKIYADFYRNDQWEELHPSSYNCDYISPNGSLMFPLDTNYGSSDPSTNVELGCLTMRYANYPRDIFTGMLPRQQYGSTVYVDVNSDIITGVSRITLPALHSEGKSSFDVVAQSLSSGSSNYQLGHLDEGSDSPITALANTTLSPHSKTGSFSVLDLRYAQALQKYREVTQSHKLNYKSQISAHFDVNVSDDRSDTCKYLGGRVSTFNLNEVTNTNITGSNEASIVSNGVSSTDCEIDFTSREHGVIMGIYYVEPLLDYTSVVSPFNLKTTADEYFQPEFDNLGLQPANVYGMSDVFFSNAYFAHKNTPTIGYLPRYYEYKIPQDTIDNSALAAFPTWVAPVSLLKQFYDANGSLIYDINYRCFKIKPANLNKLFNVQIGSSSPIVSFRLLCCFTNNCVAIRPMSESGMPY